MSAIPAKRISQQRSIPSGRWRIHPVVPFVAPMLLFFSAVLLFPLAYSIYLSFSTINSDLQVELSGLGNYGSVLSDPTVLRAFTHSAMFTLGTVAGEFVLGLATALLLNQQVRGRRWFRLAILLPWAIPTVVGALTWRWMLNSQVGLINDWLVRLGILEQFRSWTGSPDTALPVLILVNIWRGFPFMAIVLLAALQSIPKDLYEASAVDGAGRLQQFRDVTMPGLRYTVAIVTTISAIWAFKEFTLIEILTEGGPAGASEVVGTLVYRMFFRFSRFGDAAALGVLILIILFIVSLFYVRLISSAEERGKD